MCFTFARFSKCDKDACTFQHVSSGQLKKALCTGSGMESGTHHERHYPKGADRSSSEGAGKGKDKRKGKGKSKVKSDAAPSNEDGGKVDLKALPVEVRRQLSRRRWCADFFEGWLFIKKDPCSLPHHLETVVAETKEK